MKMILKKIFPKKIIKILSIFKNTYLGGLSEKSYSQEGEDMILRRLFEGKDQGFYVDVGAHHPIRFSNTYYFYKRGWRGINIDAMPGSMIPFFRKRSRDINIEAPISDVEKMMTYYMFNEPALNGFSQELSVKRDEIKDYKIISTCKMRTKTLTSVLDENIVERQEIDFLSIDVEGEDFNVLKSLNFSKYRPKIILIEALGGEALDKLIKSEISEYLAKIGYEILAKTKNTVFYSVL